MQRLSICVPPGHHPGMEVLFLSPQGVQMKAVIPAGVQAGQTFHVDVPASHSPVPVAVPIASPQNALPAGMNAMPQAVGSPVGMPAARSTPPSYNPSDSPPMGLPVEAIVAAQHAECPICFEPLHSAPVGVFVDAGGKRVSMHFFNLNAAQAWLQTGNGLCPVTRKPIRGTLRIPDLRTDPNGWFDAVDLDGDGRLSRREVISALKAQLPIDNAKLDQAAIDPNHWMWQQWDSDGSGHIERRELLHPQGLANYVTNVFGRDAARVGVPSIHSDKEGWFRFWDEDDSGTLEKGEVVRALVKTLCAPGEGVDVPPDVRSIQTMRSTIDAIWPIFDTDGSGSIERLEFLRPADGLADTIIATARQSG